MLRWRRLEISGGFLLLLALLYYMDQDGLLVRGLAACVMHELGHLSVIRLLGGKVAYLRLSCVGAEIHLSGRKPMGPTAQILSAAAGPAVNLLVAILAARWGGERGYCFAGLNLALALFNLLPVAQLDGGRIVIQVLRLLRADDYTDRVVWVASVAIVLGLILGGVLLWHRGEGNLTLPLTAGWLLLSLQREKENYET